MVISHACWSGFLDLSAQTGVLPIPHEQRSFECHIDQLRARHYRQGRWRSNGFLIAAKQKNAIIWKKHQSRSATAFQTTKLERNSFEVNNVLLRISN
jgi:hypothetical protein